MNEAFTCANVLCGGSSPRVSCDGSYDCNSKGFGNASYGALINNSQSGDF